MMLMVSCSRKISDPCENINPQSTVNITSDTIVCFESIDSYDLNLKNKKKITINGELFLPEFKRDIYNAVIMTHGSGGKRR
jgi:cephalosporin-C deacetylase-like acetyl esterase